MKNKVITIKIDNETNLKLEDINTYYKIKQHLNISRSEIIRLAIHCLWLDIKDNI